MFYNTSGRISIRKTPLQIVVTSVNDEFHVKPSSKTALSSMNKIA